MSKILIMDELLANKIAAGEVVEKVYNVVKELVENSIDAKANEISIDLIDSGIKEIRIIDNGIGMDKDDASLAFFRHATSKIKKEDDLFRINSLGFRGEALPSIASVSNIMLKTSNGKVGTEVVIDAGKIIEVKSTDLRKGTSITVSNLFYNTPVRLKYLKNPYQELSYITEYVNKMALSYPNIKFTLINNDKVLLKTDGTNRLLKVINDIYGVSIAKKMIEINNSNNDYLINGYISYPEVYKQNKNSITILVNGRVIKNQRIIKVIRDSYHTFMPSDKYPIVVLNIIVDSTLIDVNVHPTKMDIKFSKMEVLEELIITTIKDNLKKLTLIPNVTTKEEIKDEKTLIEELIKEEMKPEVKEYNIERLTLDFETSVVEQVDLDKRIKKMYPVGLVHGTYIVAENEEGMFLIDQHAAAERINYEYYLAELTKKSNEVIDLLIPITIELPNNEYLILKENFTHLADLGIGYEEFGINTIVIRSIPLFLTKTKEEVALRKIIDIIVEKEDFSLEKYSDKVAMMIACKASIKANEHITLEDMEILLENLAKCDNSFTCPHGRPTIITYSKYELEKLFKRASV